ncbi:MAG: DUF1328 domain-containing protein [Alphaproteobacteria bacterium]
MIQWAFTFFIATLITIPFAFGGMRPHVEAVGQGFFVLFLVLFLGSAVQAFRHRRKSEG